MKEARSMTKSQKLGLPHRSWKKLLACSAEKKITKKPNQQSGISSFFNVSRLSPLLPLTEFSRSQLEEVLRENLYIPRHTDPTRKMGKVEIKTESPRQVAHGKPKVARALSVPRGVEISIERWLGKKGGSERYIRRLMHMFCILEFQVPSLSLPGLPIPMEVIPKYHAENIPWALTAGCGPQIKPPKLLTQVEFWKLICSLDLKKWCWNRRKRPEDQMYFFPAY